MTYLDVIYSGSLQQNINKIMHDNAPAGRVAVSEELGFF
jgi:hypothetical protein